MKIIKKVLIVLLVIIMFNFIPNKIFTVEANGIAGAIQGAGQFVNRGQNQAQQTPILDAEGFYNVLNFIYSMLLIAGITFAVIRGILIGNQMILGTLDERKEAKDMLVPYLWLVASLALGNTIIRVVARFIAEIFN